MHTGPSALSGADRMWLDYFEERLDRIEESLKTLLKRDVRYPTKAGDGALDNPGADEDEKPEKGKAK
jgi:hypothetical protein